MRWLGWALAALAFCFCCLAGAALGDERIAVVVGNSRYDNTPALANPVNDAMDVAAALSELGFKVTLRLDATKRQLDQTMEQFARDAKSADAAVFYYAGHGLQHQGRNYLMPIDARLLDDISLRYEMTAVEDVKDALNASRGVKILVLDSCRDNPLADRLKRSIPLSTRDVALPQGLARDEGAGGMIVVYSTQANQVARDGQRRNSPFTTALLKELKTPGLEVGALFRRVGGEVYKATGGAQSPELSISLAAEYYLNQSDTDQTVWSRIRAGSDVSALEDFIARFPRSFFVLDATARIELIESKKRTQAEVEETKPPPTKPRDSEMVAEAANRPVVAELPAAAAPSPAQVAEASPQAAETKVEAPKPDVAPLIRAELRRLGCYEGADAEWSAPPMKSALAKYARMASHGRAVGDPDPSLLEEMKRQRGGLCAPACSAREVAMSGRCVARSCRPGEYLTNAGACVRPGPLRRRVELAPRPAPPPVHEHRRREPPAAGEGGRCFVFNGARYCE